MVQDIRVKYGHLIHCLSSPTPPGHKTRTQSIKTDKQTTPKSPLTSENISSSCEEKTFSKKNKFIFSFIPNSLYLIVWNGQFLYLF